MDNVGRKGALLYVAGPLYVVAWTRAESKPSSRRLLRGMVGRPRFEFHAGVDGDGQGPRPADPHRRARAAGRRRRRVVRRGARLRRRDGAGGARGALGSVTQLAVTVGILLAYVAGALAPHESLESRVRPRAARRGARRVALLALVGAVLGGGVVARRC